MKPLKISFTCSEKQLWLCGNSALFTQPPCLSSALFCRLQSSCDELLHELEFTQLSLKANSHWGKLIPNLADGFFSSLPFPFFFPWTNALTDVLTVVGRTQRFHCGTPRRRIVARSKAACLKSRPHLRPKTLATDNRSARLMRQYLAGPILYKSTLIA